VTQVTVRLIAHPAPALLFEPARPRLDLNALGAVRLRTSRDRPRAKVESMWLCYWRGYFGDGPPPIFSSFPKVAICHVTTITKSHF
jgi:hypothetical protein